MPPNAPFPTVTSLAIYKHIERYDTHVESRQEAGMQPEVFGRAVLSARVVN